MVKVFSVQKYLEKLEAHLIPTEEQKERAPQIFGEPIPGPWVNIENDCTNEQSESNLEDSNHVNMSFPSKYIAELMRAEEKENVRQIIPVISMEKDTQQKVCVLSEQPGFDAPRICDSGSKGIVQPTLGPQVYLRDLSGDNMPVNGDLTSCC